MDVPGKNVWYSHLDASSNDVVYALAVIDRSASTGEEINEYLRLRYVDFAMYITVNVFA